MAGIIQFDGKNWLEILGVAEQEIYTLAVNFILKGLPVLQCENCNEYLIDDPVMSRVEAILERVSADAELEIIRYAA